MTRVLLLFEFGTLNGGEHSMLSVLSECVGTELEFVALAPPEGGLIHALDDLGVPIVPFRCRNEDGVRRPADQISQELVEAVRKTRPDLLHANSLSMGRITGRCASQLAIPCTAHLRDIIGLSHNAILELNGNGELFAVSQAVREFHQAQGIDAERICVIHNGIDCERFQPRPSTGSLQRELRLPDDAFLIANIGQICLRKGQDVFARAAGLIADELPQAHFLLIGERHSSKDETLEFEDAVIAEFERNGLDQRFHRLGHRDDIDRLLPELDLVVHCARQEPFGRVLLEAAAAGRPIVATDVGGTEELLTHQDSAVLLPPDQPEDLAAAIVQLMRQPERREWLGFNARARVAAAFPAMKAARLLTDQWRLQLGSTNAESALDA